MTSDDVVKGHCTNRLETTDAKQDASAIEEESAMGATNTTGKKNGNGFMGALRRLFGMSDTPETTTIMQAETERTEGRATDAAADIPALAEESRAHQRDERSDSARRASKSEDRVLFQKKPEKTPEANGTKRSYPNNRRFAALTVFMAFALALTLSPQRALADDLVNTVPNDEAGGSNFYSGEIKTGFGLNSYSGTAQHGPGYGPYTVSGVYQSQSTQSATSFAAGLPLGTIFIDQSKIGPTMGTVKMVSDNTAILAGLVNNCGGETGRVGYDGTKENAIKLVPGKINKLDGDLFTVTFADAAIKPNGERADLVITYSNARIVIDQRYAFAPEGERYYHGAVSLAQGNAFSYGGTDTTSVRDIPGARDAVSATAKGFGSNYTTSSDTGNNRFATTGLTMDATYQIVNKDGTPTAGTFVFAICGINLDRDPDVGGANNVAKPLWYSYADSFGGENGKVHSFFSEAMEITGGQASDYVYVRPNNTQEDNSTAISGTRGQFFWPNVAQKDGKTKFISNAVNSPSLSGHDASYSAGFVTLADAATGFKVTATGHGNYGQGMNSLVFNSKQIWYRYISSTGAHGTIQTTSEGNYNKQLTDGGNVLEPGTYVVAEGKTVTYTMTPDIGYKLSQLKINDAEVKFNSEAVSRMKKGDSMTVTTAADKEGTLTYEENGTYSFVFPYAKHDEKIHVEWEPTTADILFSKIWDDEDDKDGMRKLAYGTPDWPKVKLQQSIDGGATWTDVTANAHGGANSVSPQDAPSGKTDNVDEYKDGMFAKDNGTQAHPFTWEYLPVYTYDSNGTADRLIQYRIVEGEAPGTDPALNGYKSPQYADGQTFYLTSEETKAIDGWIIYKDTSATVPSYYILKDGKYYAVTDWKAGSTPASPQPDKDNLTPVPTSEYKTINGKQVVRDPTTGKEYVKDGENYYEVFFNSASEVPAKFDSTTDQSAFVRSTMNGYNTADKAIPYQSVSVKNEHTVSDIYVDVTKQWNDASLFGKVTTDVNRNEYDRRDITFILHGTINNGATVVDLAPNDGNTTDLTITLNKGEKGTKEQKAKGLQVYKDSTDGTKRYVKLGTDSNPEYHVVTTFDTNGDSDTGSYESAAAEPQPNAENLSVAYNETYKLDADNFGVRFEGLQAYHDGKLIEYTVTESYDDAGAWTVTGGKLTQNKESNAVTGYTMSDLTAVKANEDLLGYTAKFINTPIVDDEYTPLPVTINKKDAYTNSALEGATFTVYTDPFNKVLPTSSTYKQIDNLTVLQDSSKQQYVLKDGKYYAVTNDTIASTPASPQPNASGLSKVENENFKKVNGQDVWTDKKGHDYILQSGKYYEVDADGNVASSAADPQPTASDLSKIKTVGAVDEIYVITDANGAAHVNFNQTGTYYIVETSAPDGYEADPKMYQFEVDKKLKSITFKEVSTENPDPDHETPWWERLWNLIFGSSTNTETNWVQANDKMSGTLTVKDTPLIANIMVRKTWDDANNQDGVRPNTEVTLPQVTLQYTTDDITDATVTPQWHTAQVYDPTITDSASGQAVGGLKDVDTKQVTNAGGAIHADANNAYTWLNLPAYRDGKVVYYRILETGQVLNDGTYKITKNETVSSQEGEFKLVDDSLQSTNQIVEIVNKHEPQTITIDAVKQWNDNSVTTNRPQTLKVKLWKTVNNVNTLLYELDLDGQADEPTADFYEVSDPDSNIWRAISKTLPAYENGSPITYRIEEELDGTTRLHYVEEYSVSYTKTDGTAVDANNQSSVRANDVKRTYAEETYEDAGTAYTVYTAGGKAYINRGTDAEPSYYEVLENGVAQEAAYPQPTNPAVSYTETENTEATIKVVNTSKDNVDAYKYWLGGANANVRFSLYRTTNSDYVNINDANDVITKEAYEGLGAEQQSGYKPLIAMQTATSNARPIKTTETITTDAGTESVYVHANGKRYVMRTVESQDLYYEVTGDTVSSQGIPYTDIEITTWTPFNQDGTTLKDGWELVGEHLFVSSAFATSLSLPGDDENHVFEDLPKLDENGNPYTYRIYETTTEGSATDERFEGHYSENGLTVTNINKKVESGSANVDVLKDLQGRGWNDDDVFYFYIDPIKNIDDETGEITEFSSSETDVSAKSNVPIPGDGHQYGRALKQNTAVGSTSRKVSFSPIVFDLNVLGDEKEKTYYYKVYESIDNAGKPVYQIDDNGITYDGTTDSDTGVWTPKTFILKVVATADDNGVITTERQWAEYKNGKEPLRWSPDTPVFQNVYSSKSDAKLWIEKNLASRAWVQYADGKGDAYQFTINSISGAPLNTPNAENGDAYHTMPLVTSNTIGNPQTDLQNYDTSKWAFGVTGNPITGDMLNSNGEATFIYEVFENDKANSTTDSLGLENYVVDGVEYDPNKVYLKVTAKDNWDGTISFDVHYYSDASCKSKYEITGNQLWIIDKSEKVYVNNKNTNETKTEDQYNGLSEEDKNKYHLTRVQTKRLLTADEITAAEGMTTDAARVAAGYRKVNVAYFTNIETNDITVKKEWVNGPAVEDVTLHLVRHLFDLDEEESLNAAYIAQQEKAWNEDPTVTDDYWQVIARKHDAPRGDFLKNDGTPDYDNGSSTTTTRTYENISGFNTDLPKYVKVTENGREVLKRAVYKLVEDDTSDAYETTYRSSKSGSEDVKNNQLYLDGETLIVTNTVKATNTANVAIVKQLLGRNWTDQDDFAFTLTPSGKAIYDASTGEFSSVDTSEAAKAAVPMPQDDVSRYSKTTGMQTTTHAKDITSTVDINGNLERLGRFGAINFTVNDLEYNEKSGHYQGDFFYTMKESLPAITTEGDNQSYPTAYTYSYADGNETKSSTVTITNKQLPDLAVGQTLQFVKWNNGITYDMTEHTVHVRVRENRTNTLFVQIGYDESRTGDVATGTQYTPVCTNTYDAEGTAAIEIEKYIMGREWNTGQASDVDGQRDSFTFTLRPIGSAPFEGADDDFVIDDGKISQTITVTGGGTDMKTAKFAALHYLRSDLPWTVGKDGAKDPRGIGTSPTVKYSDGTTAPEGTKYSRFIYAVNETSSAAGDLRVDGDTEYVRISVIDKGDGTLDTYVDTFSDSYARNPRYKYDPETGEPDKTKPSGTAIFVNQLKRDLSITKTWSGYATSDVNLRLQWSTTGENWYNVDGTAWLSGIVGNKTIKKDATGDALKVTWEGLPAYANIKQNGDMEGGTADEYDLNDMWLYYQVVEDPIANVTTTYSDDATNYSATYKHTEAEKSNDNNYIAPDNRIKDLYVKNTPDDIAGTARFAVVKQFIGKVWQDEEFTFQVRPVKSKLGDENDFTPNTERTKKMPTAFENGTSTATANKNTIKVSDNEHGAFFNTLTIKRSDLGYDQSDATMKGEFIYEISEVVPDGAVEITDPVTSKKYWAVKNADGQMVKYTQDTHTVKIVAKDDGSGSIDTVVSFDDREPGEFIPVYTNYAMITLPLEGTKTWEGGDESQHVNGSVELDTTDSTKINNANDNLRLQLKRKSAKPNSSVEDVTKDDAGRNIAIVWVKENTTTEERETGNYVNKDDSTNVIDSEAYDALEEYGKQGYSPSQYASNDDPNTTISSTAYNALTEEEKQGYSPSQYARNDDPATISSTEYNALPDYGKQDYLPEKEIVEVKNVVKHETGDGTFTVKVLSNGEYLDPALNKVDSEGYEYTYSVTEGSVPNGYSATCEGMNVTNASVPATVDLSANKELTGRNWRSGDSFTFAVNPYGAGTYDESGNLTGVDTNKSAEIPFYADSGGNRQQYVTESATTGASTDGTIRNADFGNITIELADLDQDRNKGDFYYLVQEQIGENYALLHDGNPEGSLWVMPGQEGYRVWRVNSQNYWYKVNSDGSPKEKYSTDSANGTLWLDTTSGITYSSARKYLHVHAEYTPGQSIQTTLTWRDTIAEISDSTKDNAGIPTITNSYDATGAYWFYNVKDIEGRNWKEDAVRNETTGVWSGDAFEYRLTAVGNTAMNPVSDAGKISDSVWSTAVISPVNKNVQMNLSTGAVPSIDMGNNRWGALAGMGTFWLDEIDSLGSDFIYELHEVDPSNESTYSGGGSARTTKVADLDYDDARLYLKITVRDQGNGTLSTSGAFYTDASCTEASLLKDGDSQFTIPVDGSGMYNAEGTASVPAALFTNTRILNIPVSKKWVDSDGNAIDPTADVLLRLQVAKLTKTSGSEGDVRVTGSDGITYYVSEADWQPTQFARSFSRDDFYVASFTIGGEPKTLSRTEARSLINAQDGITQVQFDSASWTLAKDGNAAKAVEHIFEGVPNFAEDGRTELVYRVNEIVTPNSAYKMSSQLELGDGQVVAGDFAIYVSEGTIAVTNTVEANNTVEPAAVKQLIGRNWKGDDRFDFTIESLGMATYDGDGNLNTNTDARGYNPLVGVALTNGAPMPSQAVATNLGNNTPVPIAAKGITPQDNELANNQAAATSGTADVAVGEHLASFGSITYDESNVALHKQGNNLMGDFYYQMYESVPNNAVATDKDGNVLKVNADGAVADDGAELTYEVAKSSYWLATYKSDHNKDYDTKAFRYFTVKQGDEGFNGITYDAMVHLLHVHVQENSTNELVASIVYDQTSATDDKTGTKFTPVFTNTFNPDEIKYVMLAEKSYADRAGQKTIGDVSEEFNFTLRPVSAVDDSGTQFDISTVPMPTDYYTFESGTGLQGSDANRVYYARNKNNRVLFEQDSTHALTFTRTNNLGKTYTYELAEIVPDDAVYIGDGFWYNAADDTVYDGVVHLRALKVIEEGAAIEVKAVNIEGADHKDKYLNPSLGAKYSEAKSGTLVDVPDALANNPKYPRHKNQVPQFLNYHNPTVDVTATKVWDDANNVDKRRPGNTWFTLHATIDGESAELSDIKDVTGTALTKTVKIAGTNSTDSTLKAAWNDLPLYTRTDDGSTATPAYKRINYTLTETDRDGSVTTPPGYSQKIEGSDTTGFTVTNTHVPKVKDVAVTKIWDDTENQDRVRPENVTFHIDQTLGTKITTDTAQVQKANEGNSWKVVWHNLPVNAPTSESATETNPYAYSMRENTIPGYTAGDFEKGKSDLRATLVWDDSSVTKPASVTATLINNEGTATSKTASLYEGNGWTATFGDVDNADQCSVSLSNMSAAQQAASHLVVAPVEKWTIKNTRVPATTQVTAKKVWDDADNVDNARPNVTLQLQQKIGEGEFINSALTDAAFEIKSSATGNEFEKTWSNLPLKNAGDAIEYRVVEKVNDATVEANGSEASIAAGYKAKGVKTGDDESGYTYTFTNSKTPDTTSIKLTKTWDDASNQDGVRPEHVEFELSKKLGADSHEWKSVRTFVVSKSDAVSGNANQWAYTIDSLPVHELDQGTSMQVFYKIEERSADTLKNAGYNVNAEGAYTPAAVTPVDGAQAMVAETPIAFEVTNTRETDTLTVVAKKAWDDYNNVDNSRVDVKLQLQTRHVGEGEDKWIPANVDDATFPIAKDAQESDMSKTWSGLKTKELVDGTSKALEYRAVELDENGKPANADDSAIKAAGYESSVVAFADNAFGIVNARPYGSNASVTVSKVWDDGENINEMRPESVTFRLYQDGNDTGMTVTLDGTPDNDGEIAPFKATFTGLPVNKATNTPYEYTVKEDQSEALVLGGYTVSYLNEDNQVVEGAEAAVDGGAIKNTRTGEAAVKVTKVWDDASNADGKRKNIKIRLERREGGKTAWRSEKTFQTPETDILQDTYSFIWTNEDLKADSLPLNSASTDDLTGLTTASVSNHLAFADDTGMQVQSDDVKNGYVVTELAQNADGEWKPIAESEMRHDYRDVVYQKVGDSSTAEFEVHNVHVPETRPITVTKVWANDEGVEKPESVKFTLKASVNGDDFVKMKDLELSANNGWTYTSPNLEVYRDGQKIEYSVEENADTIPANATPSYTKVGESSFVITNTFAAKPVATVHVTKVWSDNGKKNVEHPAITFKLQKKVGDDGVVDVPGAEEKAIPANATGDALSATWTDLPVAENGKPITYSVAETDVPAGFQVSYSDGSVADNSFSYTVTNTAQEDGAGTISKNAVKGVIMVTYVDHLNTEGSQVVEAYKVEAEDVVESKLKAKADSAFAKKYYTPTTDSQVDKSKPGTSLVTQSDDGDANAADSSDAQAKEKEVGAQAANVVDDAAASDAESKEEPLGETLGLQATKNVPGVVPADPSHEGYEFAGWQRNQDAYGNYVLVAQYTQKNASDFIVVTYIDCKSKDPKVKSVIVPADQADSVEPPDDPSHKGLKFIGWKLVKDEAGNYIYVAQYEQTGGTPDDSTPGLDTPDKSGYNFNVGTGGASRTNTTKTALPTTGDQLLDLAILLGILAVLAAGIVALVLIRRRAVAQTARLDDISQRAEAVKAAQDKQGDEGRE